MVTTCDNSGIRIAWAPEAKTPQELNFELEQVIIERIYAQLYPFFTQAKVWETKKGDHQKLARKLETLLVLLVVFRQQRCEHDPTRWNCLCLDWRSCQVPHYMFTQRPLRHEQVRVSQAEVAYCKPAQFKSQVYIKSFKKTNKSSDLQFWNKFSEVRLVWEAYVQRSPASKWLGRWPCPSVPARDPVLTLEE